MILKRCFDLLTSVLLLLILSPILVLISILSWVTFGRPIFFRQVRVGCGGRLFRIVKFRTMFVAKEGKEGELITASTDQRITGIGRILRRYKLDELPQLLNVLLGSMSLVGPRPEVPKYVALYPEDVRKCVLSVPPGITDIASIEFYNEERLLGTSGNIEEAYIKELLPLKLALAQKYVEKRGLLLDIKLLIRTVFKLLGNKHEIRN